MNRVRGYSLVEIMVALLIFSIGLLGLVGMQTRAVQLSADADDTNRAALLASQIGAAMWTGQNIAVEPALVALWQMRVADPQRGGLPNGAGSIELADGIATIRIEWKPPGAKPASPPRRYVTHLTLP